MKEVIIVLGIIFLLVIVICVTIGMEEDDQATIQKWAASQSYKIVSSERVYFDTGPFWYRGKHHRIYKVIVQTPVERMIYFRFGTFGELDKEWLE